MTRPGLASNQAFVICRVCDDAGVTDVEAIATVGMESDDRGRPYAALESLECPEGHSIRDLSPSQVLALLDSACVDLDARDEALESLRNDQKLDSWRDDG